MIVCAISWTVKKGGLRHCFLTYAAVIFWMDFSINRKYDIVKCKNSFQSSVSQ